MSHRKELEDLLYCIAGYVEDYNNRNYGVADSWLRHIRQHWEGFIEKHEENDNPYQYQRKLNRFEGGENE